MNCTPEVAEILVAILQTGLLRIRALGWSNESRSCAALADHLHNIPSLLTDYSVDRLRYYWEAERTDFLRQTQADEAAIFEPMWNRLESYMIGERAPSLSA